MDKNNLPIQTFMEPSKFIGKDVIDSKGNICGKIKSIYINPQTLGISGMQIKRGMLKDYLVTNEYFEKFENDRLHLNTIPIKPGDKVVNTNGKNIGKVKNIIRDPNTNELQTLEVKSLLNSEEIPLTEIVGVGKKITIK